MADYLVTWEINVEADSHLDAAHKARSYQLPGTTATVFDITDEHGNTERIDLPENPTLQSSQTAPAVPEGWKLERDGVFYLLTAPNGDMHQVQPLSFWPEKVLAQFMESMLTATPSPDHSPDAGKVLPVAIPDSDFDETDPIHQAADAYSYACEIMEQYQTERVEAGKEPGTTGSLCDGIAWLYQRIQELEDHSPDAGKVVQGEPVGQIEHGPGGSVDEYFYSFGSQVKMPIGTKLYTHPAESREEIHRLGQQLYEAARCLGCAQAGDNPDATEHWSLKAEAILARLRATKEPRNEEN